MQVEDGADRFSTFDIGSLVERKNQGAGRIFVPFTDRHVLCDDCLNPQPSSALHSALNVYGVVLKGVRTILPFLTKRVVEVDAEDLLKILLSNEEHENYPREKLKCNEKLDAIDLGSVVLVTTRNGFVISISAFLMLFHLCKEVWFFHG